VRRPRRSRQRRSAGGHLRQRRAWLLDWFGRLRDRLRTVRVCCGRLEAGLFDASQSTTRLGVTGVFLDPPYPTHAADGREPQRARLYATDGGRDAWTRCGTRCWPGAASAGRTPMRIAVCGYDTDGYAALEADGWRGRQWAASGRLRQPLGEGQGQRQAGEDLVLAPLRQPADAVRRTGGPVTLVGKCSRCRAGVSAAAAAAYTLRGALRHRSCLKRSRSAGNGGPGRAAASPRRTSRGPREPAELAAFVRPLADAIRRRWVTCSVAVLRAGVQRTKEAP
jgi:hypothetical protein